MFLAQIDRFYSMPLLLLALTLIAMCAARPGAVDAARDGGPGDADGAVAQRDGRGVRPRVHRRMLRVRGRAGRPCYLVARSALAAAISVVLYFFFIRPLVTGWNSTGNPTPVLVSFAAHAGVPSLALAALRDMAGRQTRAKRRPDGVVGADARAAASASCSLRA